MTRPRFKPFFPDTGLDTTAVPNWFMVGHDTVNFVSLVDGFNRDNQKLLVRSVNTNIATVEDFSSQANPPNIRDLLVKGESPGVTYLELLDPKTHTPRSNAVAITRLQVSVKIAMRLKIAFHFVEDSIATQTNRAANVPGKVIAELDRVYREQANLTFSSAGEAQVSVGTSLRQLIHETTDDGVTNSHPEWDKLLRKANQGAEINVFFMPRGGAPSGRPAKIIGLARFGYFVCEDGMSDEEVLIALPHMVGLYRNCPVTWDDAQSDHLMFWRRAEGFAPQPFPGHRSFIPRRCANIMNSDV